MSAVNIKLGTNILNGVESIIVDAASGTGTYEFKHETVPVGSGTVNFYKDGDIWLSQNIPLNTNMAAPTTPTKSGYICVGWATTDGATVPNVTWPYLVTQNTNLYAVFHTEVERRSYVTGLGSSATSSVVYDSNTGLTDWNFEEETIEGNIFCKIPTIYRKVEASSSGQITSYRLSTWKETSDYKPYPCFVDASGVLHPYLYIGKYMSSNTSKLNSVNDSMSGMKPSVGLVAARAWNNPAYFPYDWRCQKLLQDLFTCKKKTINFNSGSTISSYMGIAHLDQYHWIYGVNKTSDGHWAFCNDPARFVATDTGGAEGTELGYNKTTYTAPGADGNITKLGYEIANPFFNYPETASGSSYSSYYCDGYFYGSGNRPVISNVGGSGAYAGPFRCVLSYGWTNAYGVRLCYLP